MFRLARRLLGGAAVSGASLSSTRSRYLEEYRMHVWVRMVEARLLDVQSELCGRSDVRDKKVQLVRNKAPGPDG